MCSVQIPLPLFRYLVHRRRALGIREGRQITLAMRVSRGNWTDEDFLLIGKMRIAPSSRAIAVYPDVKRQGSSSLPNTRQSSVDDIELDKMRQAMDASPEDKELAHTIHQMQGLT